ncbi:hypothetical protein BABINDRAFT_36271 [Babjeviella inositovora NRRL Y-12698]|uniref:Small ribosomal subunit protein bS18m n=1 Tax=Babjeviella inositovora NRRL Y-12698 TaxID=984486 RepID=A0A1E3QQR0_9ASCO|nr:uncharacterized protein BABINDRAFT_36271 [Babjeviella inositovora NRRL Y-12698]ODQ79968.1 hypothetical protein BABINDRAFT_36271 [Babjeviella inositovora NRRL Y-12698]
MHEVFDLASKNSKATEESPTNTINDRFHRSFNSGATVDPYDFNYASIKWLSKQNYETKRSKGDIMKKLNINPQDLYVCTTLLSNYTSETGRIHSAEVNNFNAITQKRLSKAIKRAQSIGLLSKWHKDIQSLLPRSSRQLRRF